MICINPQANPFLEQVHAFVTQNAVPAFAAGTPSGPVLRQLRKLGAQIGLTGVQVPVNAGGVGADFATRAAACAALAGVDFGLSMSLVNTHNVAYKVAMLGDAGTRAEVLPALLQGDASACTALTEPGTGSDFGAIQTHAKWTHDHWVISGEKTWIINARHAKWAIVYAQCTSVGDRDGIAAFLVDLSAPGCEPYALESAVDQTSIGSGGIRLDGVQVPHERMLVAPGEAFKDIMAEINSARTYVAAMCLGMLDAALATVTDYGHTRQTFGRALHQHQAWRMALAQAQSEASAAKALLEQATRAIQHQPASDPEVQSLCAQAKVISTQTAQRQLPHLLHAMGAHGLDARYPLARHCAAIHMASLTDGSDEMLLERVAALMRAPRTAKR